MQRNPQQNPCSQRSVLHRTACFIRYRQDQTLSHLVRATWARRQRAVFRALGSVESRRRPARPPRVERFPDRHSGGRRDFLYQFKGWKGSLRGFSAAGIFSIHRKKVSRLTGPCQPRHLRCIHGRLRRSPSCLPSSAAFQFRQRSQRRAHRKTSRLRQCSAIPARPRFRWHIWQSTRPGVLGAKFSDSPGC